MLDAVIKCPFPFPKKEVTTQVKVVQEVDTEDQGPQETLIYDGYAAYDEKAHTIFNSQSKQITLSGKIIIYGDLQVLKEKTAYQ